jgi:PAS domain S-box-containing protein
MMSAAAAPLDFRSEPQLAALATSGVPAWLWNTACTQVLWANPVGVLAGRNPTELGAQIARFSATLPFSGAPRLQRLRGLAGFGRTLLCSCSRIELTDRTPGFLAVALEPAGPPLTLAERIRRLLEPCEQAVMAFAGDGSLVYANAPARELCGAVSNLTALGADRLGREALIQGRATGTSPHGPLSIDRLGRDSTTVLLATFAAPDAPAYAATQQPAPPVEIAAETAPTVESIAPSAPASEEPSLPAAEASMPHAAASAQEPAEGPAEPPLDDVTTVPPLEPPSDWSAPEPIVPRAPQVRPAPIPSPSIQSPSIQSPPRERRHPLRFVWQMDLEGRFTVGSDEFTEVIGDDTASMLGHRWEEIAAELGLDPDSNVARAVASRDTWSGISVSWPVGRDRLRVELSGLPIYDPNRTFLGYRGFGVCRDTERVASPFERREPTPVEGEPTGLPAADYASTPQPRDDAAPPFTAAANVVPFRTNAAEHRATSPIQTNAFRELARQLTARLQEQETDGAPAPDQPEQEAHGADRLQRSGDASAPMPSNDVGERSLTDHPLLERLPVGILVYRLDHLLYANRAFLDWTGYANLDALAEAGGLDCLFIESGTGLLGDAGGPGKPLAITTRLGSKIPVEGRLLSVPWNGELALALMLTSSAAADRQKVSEAALRTAQAEIGALSAILDAAADGTFMLDGEGRVLSANQDAGALFGYGTDPITGSFGNLLAPDSQSMVLDRIERLAAGATSHETESCEATALTWARTPIPVVLTMCRIDGDERRVYVVLTDVSARKRVADELAETRRQAQKALSDKSEFLAKVSHEIRTPLNSIVGFSEVMLEERFGPIGNERYRDYLKDIRTSGAQVVALLNDLIDLSKIEAGKLELAPIVLNLNALVQSCVAEMQPRASRERIIIRMSLAPSLPAIVADPRSLHQIIVNLLGNSLKFTAAGGQVIVSTALSDNHEIILRVRDTGIGMSDTDVEAALEPFRQLAVRSPWGSTGSGLGLALSKRLAEANHARFNVASKIDDGTLVELIFPPAPQ